MRKIEKHIAGTAFGDTLKMAARLSAFATAHIRREVGNGLVVVRARELAHRDIIFLAISARRLAEVSGLKKLLKDQSVSHVRPFLKGTEAGFYSISQKSTAWDILGLIIHSNRSEIYQDDASVKRLLGEFKGDLYEAYKAAVSARDVSAACFVESDRGKPVLFSLVKLINVIQELLSEAEEVLSDHDIYLGNYATD